MNKKIKCIMLVDDNPHDNLFHEREIKKNDSSITVIPKNSGIAALEYLKSKKDNEDLQPSLIFLDINMPGMNGWEFLKEYSKLDKKLQGHVIVVMLTTSENSDEKLKAKKWDFVADYMTKPLTKTKLEEIINKYFSP